MPATPALPLTLEPPHAADADLARRCARGDDEAFRELYVRHAELVFNLCLRLAGEREAAADLAQEVFLRVYRHVGRFRGGSTLRTWIYRVAVNHCRSRLARRRPEVSLEARREREPVEPVAPGPDPEAVAAGAELDRRLERALATLPPAFREAVVLRDLEGLTYEEIAEVLRLPSGTVRSRIARGREALRLALEATR